MTQPTISREEFFVELTEIAKDAIRTEFTDEDGVIDEDAPHRAQSIAYVYDGEHEFVQQYPLAVEMYADEASWVENDWDMLKTARPADAIQLARTRMFGHLLAERLEVLLNGGWDAVVERTRIVSEEVTVGDSTKQVEGEETYLVLEE